MQPTIDRIRALASRNRLSYLEVLEAIVARVQVDDQVLEAARRELRERDRFTIETDDQFAEGSRS